MSFVRPANLTSFPAAGASSRATTRCGQGAVERRGRSCRPRKTCRPPDASAPRRSSLCCPATRVGYPNLQQAWKGLRRLLATGHHSRGHDGRQAEARTGEEFGVKEHWSKGVVGDPLQSLHFKHYSAMGASGSGLTIERSVWSGCRWNYYAHSDIYDVCRSILFLCSILMT